MSARFEYLLLRKFDHNEYDLQGSHKFTGHGIRFPIVKSGLLFVLFMALVVLFPISGPGFGIGKHGRNLTSIVGSVRHAASGLPRIAYVYIPARASCSADRLVFSSDPLVDYSDHSVSDRRNTRDPFTAFFPDWAARRYTFMAKHGSYRPDFCLE